MKLLSFKFNEKKSTYYFEFEEFSFEYIGNHIIILSALLLSTSEDKWMNRRTKKYRKRGVSRIKKDVIKRIDRFFYNRDIQIKRINKYDLILETDRHSKLILFSNNLNTNNNIGNFEFAEFYNIKHENFMVLKNKKINQIDIDQYDEFINFKMNFDKMNLRIFCCAKIMIKDELVFISYDLRKEANEKALIEKINKLISNKTILDIKIYSLGIYRIECEEEIFIYLYCDNRIQYKRYLSLTLDEKGLKNDLVFYGCRIALLERII